jgi:mannose-6-phosphate isomerase-like protein (cupin superfamily)
VGALDREATAGPLASPAALANRRLDGENIISPGCQPPMHVHHLQEEVLTVRQGRMGYQRLGKPVQYAGPGETVAFAPGEAHKFWNAGEASSCARGTSSRCTTWSTFSPRCSLR